ncbi:NAD-dependent epimerase/dehydratase family protein [Flavobacteriaceae bacterium AH-315-B10]|nr:NAD-dependent epimerase/dehydratase family protein [Flavobacteriaceae bacterium AH-315-B10]
MILVTGGTGLVGSHLLYKLVEKGYKVRATYRSKKKIDAARHVFSYYTKQVDVLFSKIEWVEVHLNDIPALTIAFKSVSKVYHCAALVSFDPNDYLTLRRINIEGTANIVNLCLANNIEKLCYVSSIAAIGHGEPDDTIISEKTNWIPEEDHNVYAITKYGAELEVWRGVQEGLDAVIINPGFIFGPGFWRTSSGSLFKKIYKGLSHYTNGVTGYVDIDDVVNSMLLLMDSTIRNERYILVAENMSFKEFATITAQELKVKTPKKEASKRLLQIVWRLDWLNHLLRRKRRKLTRQMARTISEKYYYSNKKIITDLDFKFKPIDVSISETCRFFLLDEEK